MKTSNFCSSQLVLAFLLVFSLAFTSSCSSSEESSDSATVAPDNSSTDNSTDNSSLTEETASPVSLPDANASGSEDAGNSSSVASQSAWGGTVMSNLGGNEIVLDTARNIYLLGTGNWGTFSLQKYNSLGTEEWATMFSSSGNHDSLGKMILDSQGNIYITGTTDGVFTGQVNAGGNNGGAPCPDVFLIKFSNTGVQEWVRQFGTPCFDFGNGVAVDSQDNIYVVGSTDGGLDNNTSPTAGAFIAKYTPSGSQQWVQEIAGENYYSSVSIDSSDNIYIVGKSLTKLNNLGVEQWKVQGSWQGNPLDYSRAEDLSVDSVGNIYVTGFTYNGIGGSLNAGGTDAFLIQYNASGVEQWARLFGGTGNDSGNALTLDSAGNIYLTGGVDGTMSRKDILILKYDSSGQKQWIQQLGSTSYNYGSDIATDSSGDVYVTGLTYSNLDSNIPLSNGSGFILKLDGNGVKQ